MRSLPRRPAQLLLSQSRLTSEGRELAALNRGVEARIGYGYHVVEALLPDGDSVNERPAITGKCSDEYLDRTGLHSLPSVCRVALSAGSSRTLESQHTGWQHDRRPASWVPTRTARFARTAFFWGTGAPPECAGWLCGGSDSNDGVDDIDHQLGGEQGLDQGIHLVGWARDEVGSPDALLFDHIPGDALG